MVGGAGIAPAVSCAQGRWVRLPPRLRLDNGNRTRYSRRHAGRPCPVVRVQENGRGDPDRTGDLLVPNEARSHCATPRKMVGDPGVAPSYTCSRSRRVHWLPRLRHRKMDTVPGINPVLNPSAGARSVRDPVMNLEPTAGVEPASSSLREMTWPTPHAGMNFGWSGRNRTCIRLSPLRIRQVPRPLGYTPTIRAEKLVVAAGIEPALTCASDRCLNH